MVPWNLVLALASTLAADLPPEELVARLRSPDRVVREEAARTLEERGPDALPALRAARGAAEGAEARDRLADLIARVEARSLDRPTLVTLDFDDRPLGEAVAALAGRSGFELTLDGPGLADRRVTARSTAPLPFWEALDRLGRAGHVRHDPSPRQDAAGNDPRASTIRLVDGEPPALAAYAGPLRVHLFASHRHGDVSFEVGPIEKEAKHTATVTFEVQAFAEPGRSLNPNGPPRLEVVDDRGRAISPRSGGNVEESNPAEQHWLIPGRASLLHWHVPIELPNPPARSPLRVRGVLPVVLASRRPDPLVIPVADAVGKTFRQGPGSVRIERVAGNVPTTMIVLGEDSAPNESGRASTGPEEDHIGDFPRNRIEFEDAEGHRLSWNLAGNPANFPNPNGELRLMASVSGDKLPSRLVIYRLNRLAAEIPFEIADVPSP